MAVSYSNRIRSLRKKLKMTQKQMAEQLFIDQSTLATYEKRTCLLYTSDAADE